MITVGDTCQRVIKENDWLFGRSKWVCGKTATHEIGGQKLCRHHARVGRYIVRDGDIGEILARFDTEKELRENIHLYPGMRMQKVTKSHRRDIV